MLSGPYIVCQLVGALCVKLHGVEKCIRENTGLGQRMKDSNHLARLFAHWVKTRPDAIYILLCMGGKCKVYSLCRLGQEA